MYVCSYYYYYFSLFASPLRFLVYNVPVPILLVSSWRPVFDVHVSSGKLPAGWIITVSKYLKHNYCCYF